MSQASTQQRSQSQASSTSASAMPQRETPDKYREGPVARNIKAVTAQVPSDAFLWTAGAAAIGSLALMIAGRKGGSMFLGQWVPTILICGLYNKIVKTTGHDRES